VDTRLGLHSLSVGVGACAWVVSGGVSVRGVSRRGNMAPNSTRQRGLGRAAELIRSAGGELSGAGRRTVRGVEGASRCSPQLGRQLRCNHHLINFVCVAHLEHRQ
jgi:hypothetical protein